MKRIIYIDFENVSTAGLNGILDLNEKDHVKIFLGPKCSKLSLIEAEAILHCHATVELITNDQIGKNALDFIIMVHMGYDIAKKAGKAFYIISNDKGYEPAIHEMQSMTGYTIERLSDIRQVLNEEEPAKGGLFGLFGKKAKQVQNTTEHEVYEKGKRVGQAKRSTRTEADKKNGSGGDRQRNGKKNNGGEGTRNRNGQNRGSQNRSTQERNNGNPSKAAASTKQQASSKQTPQPKQAQSKQSAQPKQEIPAKQDGSSKPVSMENSSGYESQPAKERRSARRSTRKEAENRNLEDLSVAELAKQLGIERRKKAAEPEAEKEVLTVAPAPESPVTEAADKQTESVAVIPASEAPETPAKKEKPKRPAPMNAEEKALVARAIEANEDKEAYHNYLMAELRDTQRATELYKLSKNRFLKAKEAAKSAAFAAAGEETVTVMSAPAEEPHAEAAKRPVPEAFAEQEKDVPPTAPEQPGAWEESRESGEAEERRDTVESVEPQNAAESRKESEIKESTQVESESLSEPEPSDGGTVTPPSEEKTEENPEIVGEASAPAAE